MIGCASISFLDTVYIKIEICIKIGILCPLIIGIEKPMTAPYTVGALN